jgi:hypothetical protein
MVTLLESEATLSKMSQRWKSDRPKLGLRLTKKFPLDGLLGSGGGVKGFAGDINAACLETSKFVFWRERLSLAAKLDSSIYLIRDTSLGGRLNFQIICKLCRCAMSRSSAL